MARETIEALLNPSLKVSRPVAACSRCRSAKIKCDGKLPACSACERAGKGKDCSTANDSFARGKERSYVAALETAVERLQRKIENAKMGNHASRKDSLLMLAHGRPMVQRANISQSRRKEADDVDELVSDLGFLTVNATSRDFQGFSSTMSFVKMLKAIALKDTLPVYNDSTLPPRQSITHLINHYFENNYVLLPFLSETDFMGSISRIYQENQAPGPMSPFDIWCFRLVLAISSASLCQLRGDQNWEASIYNISIAMEIADHVIYPGAISGIQALLLLVQYSLVDPEYFDSWYLVGMAARLMVDVGLHCEPAPETKISKHALDLRRRIFYCTYALDRLVSMSLGLAFSFTDDSAPGVLLPTLATDHEAMSRTQLFLRSVRPSLFLFDLRRVQSAYYQTTRWSSRSTWTMEAATTYISSTLDDIEAWQSTLPSSFSQQHLQIFQLESLYSQALVLSPNQIVPMTSINDTLKIRFFQCAIQYSGHLRNMVQNKELQSCLCYADFCRARYVSRQFQNIMWASFDLLLNSGRSTMSPAPETSLIENCKTALSFLNNMSQILEWPKNRWGISALQEIFEQESAVLLARLQTRYQECNSIQNASPSTSTSNEFSHTFTTQEVGFQSLPTSQPPQLETSFVDMTGQHLLQHPQTAVEGFSYSDPAMHRSNLLRTSSWSPNADLANPELPSGSQPRRSYQFRGGRIQD